MCKYCEKGKVFTCVNVGSVIKVNIVGNALIVRYYPSKAFQSLFNNLIANSVYPYEIFYCPFCGAEIQPIPSNSEEVNLDDLKTAIVAKRALTEGDTEGSRQFNKIIEDYKQQIRVLSDKVRVQASSIYNMRAYNKSKKPESNTKLSHKNQLQRLNTQIERQHKEIVAKDNIIRGLEDYEIQIRNLLQDIVKHKQAQRDLKYEIIKLNKNLNYREVQLSKLQNGKEIYKQVTQPRINKKLILEVARLEKENLDLKEELKNKVNVSRSKFKESRKVILKDLEKKNFRIVKSKDFVPVIKQRICKECGEEFTSPDSWQIYCDKCFNI